jgi:hypothetical protein
LGGVVTSECDVTFRDDVISGKDVTYGDNVTFGGDVTSGDNHWTFPKMREIFWKFLLFF